MCRRPVNARRYSDVYYGTNDVGFVTAVAGHYIENTGDTDLVFLEMFAADEFKDFFLNNWLRHLPMELVTAHLNLDGSTIKRIPSDKFEVV